MNDNDKALKVLEIIKASRKIWGLDVNAPIDHNELCQTLDQMDNSFLMSVTHDVEKIINGLNSYFYNDIEGKKGDQQALEEVEAIKKHLYDALHMTYSVVDGVFVEGVGRDK